MVGTVTDEAKFTYKEVAINAEEALSVWKEPLENVFPTKVSKDETPVESKLYKADSVYVCKNKVAKPTVFIPVFPGTNCEYDSTKAFERAGADVIVKVFKNLSAQESENLWMNLKRQSTSHRLSCSREDSPQVMNRTVLRSSLQRHSVTQDEGSC